MPPVTIHGNTIDPDPSFDGKQSPYTSRDAANTNYIYIQSRAPLDKAQKLQLKGLEVHIHRYEDDNTYLCRYEPTELEPLRSLSFIRHANEYHQAFKTSSILKEMPEPQPGGVLDVTIGLHKGATSSEDLRYQLVGIQGIEPSSLKAIPNYVFASVTKDGIEPIERFDAVRVIEFRPPAILHNDLARNL